MKSNTTVRTDKAGGSTLVTTLSMATLAGLVGFGAWYQTQELGQLESRIALLETDGQTTFAHQEDVRQGLEILGERIEALATQVEQSTREAQASRALVDRLNSSEERLGAIGAAVEAATSTLSDLEERVGPAPLEAVLSEQESRLWASWRDAEDSLRSEVSASRDQLIQIEAFLNEPRDVEGMWNELLGPVVQLAGEASVGSGVLLRSEKRAAGGYRTYLLTAWHVVRDIQGSPTKRDMPVPVTIYGSNGSLRQEEATLLVYQADLDAALLELVSSEPLPYGAALASPERLEKAHIFDRIYAVGCPLGNDPIPTYGEIATRNHVVDGETYWMINAPTYIGNSGGGIFDSETHELLGIFSKIYTHGALRPTIVPHMGLVTPLSRIYDWLDSQGYASVYSGAGSKESTARLASARR